NSARKAEPTSSARAGSSTAVAFIHTATWCAFESGYWTIARYAAWTVPFRTKNSESFALRSRSGGPSCSPRKTTPCSADLMSFPSGSCSGLDIGDEQRPCPTHARALLERVLDKDFAHGARKMGALCLVLVLLDRLAAGLIVIEMVVAGLKVNLPRGFYWTKGGVEVPLIFAVLGSILVLAGPGALSADALVRGRQPRSTPRA